MTTLPKEYNKTLLNLNYHKMLMVKSVKKNLALYSSWNVSSNGVVHTEYNVWVPCDSYLQQPNLPPKDIGGGPKNMKYTQKLLSSPSEKLLTKKKEYRSCGPQNRTDKLFRWEVEKVILSIISKKEPPWRQFNFHPHPKFV